MICRDAGQPLERLAKAVQQDCRHQMTSASHAPNQISGGAQHPVLQAKWYQPQACPAFMHSRPSKRLKRACCRPRPWNLLSLLHNKLNLLSSSFSLTPSPFLCRCLGHGSAPNGHLAQYTVGSSSKFSHKVDGNRHATSLLLFKQAGS